MLRYWTQSWRCFRSNMGLAYANSGSATLPYKAHVLFVLTINNVFHIIRWTNSAYVPKQQQSVCVCSGDRQRKPTPKVVDVSSPSVRRTENEVGNPTCKIRAFQLNRSTRVAWRTTQSRTCFQAVLHSPYLPKFNASPSASSVFVSGTNVTTWCARTASAFSFQICRLLG